jgi:two-component system, LytTR family, response regulator
MKAIIIDDDIMSIEILTKFATDYGEIEVVGKFQNPVKAINFLSKNEVDLVFLDIEMPEISGMELLSMLKKKSPEVVLVSSYDSFAIEAFKHNVSGYLLKPIEYTDFVKAVLKIESALKKSVGTLSQENRDIFFIKNGSVVNKVDKEQIVYIECTGDYANIITKKRKFTVKATMKDLEDKFSGIDFLRVHRSYIVRLDEIDVIQDHAIIIEGKEIPIGRTYRNSVMSKLNLI